MDISRLFAITGGTNTFADSQGHWASIYIASAANSGWIEGYEDGSFRPNNAITRAKTVTIINRAFERRANPATIDYHLNSNIFPDVSRSHWAFHEIIEAALMHEFSLDEDGLENWVWVDYP